MTTEYKARYSQPQVTSKRPTLQQVLQLPTQLPFPTQSYQPVEEEPQYAQKTLADLTRQDRSVQLFVDPVVPECCATQLLAQYLEVPAKVKLVDTAMGENVSAQFRCISPFGDLPVIYDRGHYLHGSRAILRYLISEFGTERLDSMYPKESIKRARLDAILDIDSQLDARVKASLHRPGDCSDRGNLDELDYCLEQLSGFLGDGNFFGGDSVTIADLSVYSSVVRLMSARYDMRAFPMLRSWKHKMDRVQGIRDAFSYFDRFIHSFQRQSTD